jgi:ornithine cyclodeaminase/alanine dehydrogenase-like protein (mu-crystallin family)
MQLHKKILYLSKSDIESLDIPIEEVIEVVEEAFREKAQGRVEAPPKPGIHPQVDSFIHAMPACISRARAAGIKWVSGFPENPSKGLPYISGLLILNDFDTGVPISVMDCTWITAKRTGAATAIAAKHLAGNDPKAFGVLGCGVQGRSNLEAVKSIYRNLEVVKAFDVNRHNLMKYVDEMSAKLELHLMAVDSPKQAIEGCDIVVTSGPIVKNPKPLIEASWVKVGGFACALDFDSYWKPEAMQSMDKFCTDDRNQLAYYRKQGYFRKVPRIYAEIADLVTHKKPGREHRDERIMSMNLGLAIEDISTAILVYRRAIESNAGALITL